jgi:hypothetical protein
MAWKISPFRLHKKNLLRLVPPVAMKGDALFAARVHGVDNAAPAQSCQRDLSWNTPCPFHCDDNDSHSIRVIQGLLTPVLVKSINTPSNGALTFPPFRYSHMLSVVEQKGKAKVVLNQPV